MGVLMHRVGRVLGGHVQTINGRTSYRCRVEWSDGEIDDPFITELAFAEDDEIVIIRDGDHFAGVINMTTRRQLLEATLTLRGCAAWIAIVWLLVVAFVGVQMTLTPPAGDSYAIGISIVALGLAVLVFMWGQNFSGRRKAYARNILAKAEPRGISPAP